MSISTPGGPERRPTVVSTGKKPAAGRPAADKPADGKAESAKGPRPNAGGKGRKPIAPVKVSQGRPWGPIALFVAVGVLAAGIIGVGVYYAFQGSQPWQKRADAIKGIVNYRKTDPESLKQAAHEPGKQTYKYSPPVGGVHNATWQRCLGDVYDAPIASEHAVHSLEHGAVWITYRPDLPEDQVEKLATLVRGKDFMLMSPYEGLDKPISLQAWGYQLKVDNADDPRIKEFATTLALNATVEPGVPCSSGSYTTGTGTTPRDSLPASMGN
ncbi:DUF3105 domain-containing protein [Micromonospora sp. NPDC006766]|uniref:DUF3105 domain-containing protein n=1 Tax=Micromonospora sp. NPDC006766 TaxID=3154778 RepID=UPI0033DB7BBF